MNGLFACIVNPANDTWTAMRRNSIVIMKASLPVCCSLTSKVGLLGTLSSLGVILVTARACLGQPWAPDSPEHLHVLSLISQARLGAFSVNRWCTGTVICPGNRNGNRSGGGIRTQVARLPNIHSSSNPSSWIQWDLSLGTTVPRAPAHLTRQATEISGSITHS